MCCVLKVSESGYYHSLSRNCEPKPWRLLLVKIKQVYAQHPDNDNYGVDRVRLALEQNGIIMSKSTVRRAMKKGGFIKASPHRSSSLTKADADAQKADNLIARDFTADTPNRKWLTEYYTDTMPGRQVVHCSGSGLL
jgi:putative transposase